MFAWFFEFFLWCTADVLLMYCWWTADELLTSDFWPHELVCTCYTLASRRLPCLVLTCRVAFPRRVLRLCFTSPGVGWTSPRVVNSILGLVVAISMTVPTSRARVYYIRISPLQKIVQTFSGGIPLLIFIGFDDEGLNVDTVIGCRFRHSWTGNVVAARFWRSVLCFLMGEA